MDIAGSPDIFKAKMTELMRTLKKSKDDLLTKYQVTKASLSDHLDKLKKVLTRLWEAGFKQLCAHETEYLGYILTRDGIKPQSHKIGVN